MHELDLALNKDPLLGRRTILPVMVGVDRDFHKDARKKYRQTWEAFSQLTGRDDVEQLLDRWERNLQRLEGLQAPDAAVYGSGLVKDWENDLVQEVADKVHQHVAACLGWQQDGVQPQQRQCNVHDLLPEPQVVNRAAIEQLKTTIEAACSKHAEQMQQSAAAVGTGSSGSQRVPPPVVQLLGLAGMGKSVLALQIAHHYEETGEAVMGGLLNANGSMHDIDAARSCVFGSEDRVALNQGL